MKIMLTSFGIDQGVCPVRGQSLFDRMPPVSFRLSNEIFMPDYELLILCDQVVMDRSSFYQMLNNPGAAYAGVAETFRVLNAEGRVELVDFSEILRVNSDLLETMLDHDIAILDQWVEPLRESLATWRRFAAMSIHVWQDLPEQFYESRTGVYDQHHYKALIHDMNHVMLSARTKANSISQMVELALSSAEKRKRKEYRSALREVMRGYLAYVNANLVLASELDIPFHDWLDFTPFYETKFLSVGKKEDETQSGRKQVERLFTVAFPELAIRDTRALLKVLNDKRIQDLRQLVGQAVLGKVEFDDQFAKAVLSEVLLTERKITRFRNVLGYLTLPIGFVPVIGTPVQKIVEEAVGIPLASRMKQQHRWFYMLSEATHSRD
jgi:hypothetical protein